jgi:hypothetical protein
VPSSRLFSTRALRLAAVVALLVSGAAHVQQYVDGYSAFPVVGPLFLMHAVAAVGVSAWLLATSDSAWPPVTGMLLELGALGSLAIAFTGSFFSASERGLRPVIVVTIVSEVVAVVVLALLLRRRARAPA